MSDADDFEAELAALGFLDAGTTRRGGRQWQLEFNRFLTFTVHRFGDEPELVVTWRFELGEFVVERGLLIGAGETSFQELYPANDVRVPATVDDVAAEIGRTRRRLQMDLGAPDL
jgi:hypothetical protein